MTTLIFWGYCVRLLHCRIARPVRDSKLWQPAVDFGGHLAAPDKRFAEWAKAVGVSHGELRRDQMLATLKHSEAWKNRS